MSGQIETIEKDFSDYITKNNLNIDEYCLLWKYSIAQYAPITFLGIVVNIPSIEEFVELVKRVNNLKVFL